MEHLAGSTAAARHPRGLTTETFSPTTSASTLGGPVVTRLELVDSAGVLGHGQDPRRGAASDYDTITVRDAGDGADRHEAFVGGGAATAITTTRSADRRSCRRASRADFDRNAVRMGLALGIPLIRQRYGRLTTGSD